MAINLPRPAHIALAGADLSLTYSASNASILSAKTMTISFSLAGEPTLVTDTVSVSDRPLLSLLPRLASTWLLPVVASLPGRLD